MGLHTLRILRRSRKTDSPQMVAQIQARINNLLAGMPAAVQGAWNLTMGTPAGSSPDGAWPVKYTPS